MLCCLKKVLMQKINASIWFRCKKKKTSSLIEDERRDKAQWTYTRRNPKKPIPPVSLLLWRKIVAVCRFVWPLALQLWSVSEAVRLKFEFWRFFKILHPATCKYFVAFNAVLCIIWTSTIPEGNFGRVKCL